MSRDIHDHGHGHAKGQAKAAVRDISNIIICKRMLFMAAHGLHQLHDNMLACYS